MLQPRPPVHFWLILLLAALHAKAALSDNIEEDLLSEDEEHRNKREAANGDVTVLSLDESGRLRDPPLGVISSTARTFVNDGATTEFATQIIGTTVGRTYARLLSTGSRVYYDNQKHTKDPFLVFPSIPGLIFPTKTPVHFHTAEPVLPVQVVDEKAVSLNEISENTVTEKPQPEVSVRKEFSVKRNTGEAIKPAKVKPKSDLPTVTIKNEFAPSGYSAELVEEKKEEKKPRAGKALFRGGIPVKNDFQKYDTVTYVGFADFTTTVGNTVIVFMPKTAAQASGPVTSISGAATLRPEDVSMPVVTSVKTYLSHSPGMATKTFTAQNEKVKTSLPTVKAEIRSSKAYDPVFASSEILTTEQPTTNPPTTNPPITTNPPMTTNQEQPTTEQLPPQTTEHPTESTTEEEPLFEPSETVIPSEEVKATETLPIPTYSTVKTQVFIPGDEPLGLAKSIAVIQAYDETTTYLTSFLFGTVVNGQYTLLTQVASSTSVSEIIPTSVSGLEKQEVTDSPTTEPPVTTEKSEPTESTTEKEKEDKPQKPKINYITRIIPTTIYQTYTYFTTFFIPDAAESTSVKSREVTTSEVKYITTSLPPPGYRSMSTATLTEQTTQSQSTTESLDQFTTTTAENLAEPTPHLPDAAILNPTTEGPNSDSVLVTTEPPTTTEKFEIGAPKEEEVELIFKTLYTTYTYLTTFFQETTSSVRSREVVETNVVTTTIDSEFKATDPALVGLLNSFSKSSREPPVVDKNPASIVSSESQQIEPTSTELLKTYTYYTTIFVDGETLVESNIEVVTKSIQPSSTNEQSQLRTAVLEDNNIIPRSQKISEEQKRKPSYGTISRPKFSDRPTSEALIAPFSAALQSSIDDAYAYDTTMLRDDRIVSTISYDVPVEEVLTAREEELKKEAMQAIGMTPVLGDDISEILVTDVTSSSSGGNRRPYDEFESDPNDQISSESNTEEIEPSRTPSLVLQTSYTTYTYFTTVYKGPSSRVISRLDTVTNVVTETIRPTEIDTKLSPEEATLPITYFTTFTYWTTLYKGKSTMITSREETVSNVVTPTLAPSIATVPATEVASAPSDEATPVQVVTPTSTSEAPIEPTTYFTTYTFFTTSYIGNETVINSHLQTETNVVTPTAALNPAEESAVVEEIINSTTIDSEAAVPTSSASQMTGLISTIRSSEIKDGITTLYNTDVYGTFIDGLYAQVLESSTEIVAPTSTSASSQMEVQPTGIVSINEGKIVDGDGISTTWFTTKAIGTYIDNLYAQVIESTSSLAVDEEKKTATPPLPSTTIIGTKTYTTGLVRLIEGSIVKDDSTTFYESRVIGTLIDGRYAQIIESTSSFKQKMMSTEGPSIIPTPVPSGNIQPTVHSSSPSSSVVESSLSVDEDENSDNDPLKPKQKTKASKASIRPFASRSRPNYLPKRKDPATTITRTSFTPTVTATPASKTKGFGSSRNRFAANRSKSSSTTSAPEIKPSSSSRRFGGSRTRSTSQSFGSTRSRSSSVAVRPTISSTSARRGGFNYRSTASPRPAIGASSSQRFRIRPTQALGPAKTTSPPTEDINNDINQTSTEEPNENATALDEDNTATTPPPTTTESPRRANNPLLRFRRPPILQRASTTTTTAKPTTTTRKSTLLRRPDSRSVVATTPRSRANSGFSRKPRPGSSLFPPRGLLKKPFDESEVKEEEEQGEEQEEGEQGEIDIQDNEYEGSETSEHHSSTTTESPKTPARRGKGLAPVSIRPFSRRPARSKRQAEYGNRSYQPKFRRTKSRTTVADYEDEYEQTPAPTWQTTPARYQRTRGRGSNQEEGQQQQQQQQTRQRVRPSPVTNTPRHQFTLRERSQTTPVMSQRSSFRRTSGSPRRRIETTTVGRAKAPRLRAQTTEATPRTTSRRFSTSRGSTRTTSRSRHRDNEFDHYSQPLFDGTITVTHRIPTEVTIPVVNGKNTEYKNVITAKPSLEVLAPFQYTTTTKDGKALIQLTTELTSTLPNGLMEVTKYIVYETPTTSVTFTPTTLRGRKTSFSHIVPSTVYEVRQEVSTIQPNLGNAPLANLILSQLLLGNLSPPNTGTPGEPTTEFKTKTTTYVTTVTSHTSTVLPLTFRGKEITTTIVDSSVQVITATEYITETVVITPTIVGPANNQINTLLLPALLQAQLLQPPQPQPQQYQPPVRDPLSTKDQLIDDEPDQRFAPKDDIDDGDRKVREYEEEDTPSTEAVKPKKRAKIKRIQLKPPDKIQSTSVVTLYVSGKHPGEFTTLLSTVVVDETSNVKKREVAYNSYQKNDFYIMPSRLPELGASEDSNQYFYESLSPNDIIIESSEMETRSVDNGYTKHLTLASLDAKEFKESTTGHFLSHGPADSAPEQRDALTWSIPQMRTKRETEFEPQRKRIRVRVPIRRYRNETGYIPSESAQIEDISYQVPFETTTLDTLLSHRRVKVFKKKLEQPLEIPQRKRILIRKTKVKEPTEMYETDISEKNESETPEKDQYSQSFETLPTTNKKKKVLIGRKKIIPSEALEPSTLKRRIKITRRRPVIAETTQEPTELTPTDVTIFADSPMATLYTYSGPFEEANHENVMVNKGFDEDIVTPTVSYSSAPDVTEPYVEIQNMSSLEYTHTNESNLANVGEAPTTPQMQVLEQLPSSTPSLEEYGNSQLYPDDYYDDNFESISSDGLQVDVTEPTTPSLSVEQITSPTSTEVGSNSVEEPNTQSAPTDDGNSSETFPNESTEKSLELDKVPTDSDEISTTTTESSVQEIEETPIVYHYTTKLTTTTRLRTYTYVVTRVSGTEQIVTSSTAVRPHVQTVTVSDLVPLLQTVSGGGEEGRGYGLKLSTKRMSNGVEVIVAGKQTGGFTRGLSEVRPTTLAPSTLTEHMMMLLPQETQKPHNDFVTKTYMTTYTYLTTFAQDESTVVSSREKVISNVLTEEIKPSKTKVNDHFTLSASPDLTTGVYHTTYTYLNTLVDGELPLVITSKKTVSNTVTEQPSIIQPSEIPPQDTNTYVSTVAYTKTLSEGDAMQIVSTEDILTQVVITESDFIPSSLDAVPLSSSEISPSIEITPTPITTDIVKTYYATYTYYNTNVEEGKTTINTEVVTSSDVATETFTIQPKRPKPIEDGFDRSTYQPESSKNHENDISETSSPETPPLQLFATKTYMTTYTYFTTLLQENKTPSIVVSSSTKVMQNVVTETVNPELFSSEYLDELRESVNQYHNSVIKTATLSDGAKMEITAMGGDLIKMTDKMDTVDATSPGNVVTGSTIIFFDEDDDKPSDSQALVSTTQATEEQEIVTNPPDKAADVPNRVQDPAANHHNSNKNPTKNNILQFSSLINAMADLFQTKLNSAAKNEETPRPVYRPQEEPPRPVYNPALEPDVAESQNIGAHNVYTDIQQRTQQSDRPSIEAAMLSSGIPISPGQVITTNSDVIIGKHSVHGPRPPLKPFQKEVEGMKPPPPPTSQAAPVTSNKELWQHRKPERHPDLPHRLSPEKLPLRRDPPHLPKPVPPSLSHTPIPSHKHPLKNNFGHFYHGENDARYPGPSHHNSGDSVPQSSKPIDVFYKPRPTSDLPETPHKRRPPLKERPQVYPDDTTDLRPPAIPSNYIKDNKIPVFPAKEINNIRNTVGHHVQPNEGVFPTVPAPPPPNRGHDLHPGQLLVNIQPSQVANVIIPSGVPTALIYNKEPEKPSQKGEIFSEPSPYPDAEVGIAGIAGVLEPEEEGLHATVIPSNAVRMDVPVSLQGIEANPVAQGSDEQKKNPTHFKKPLRNPDYHFSNHGLDYMKPPPPPVSELINYHLSGKEEIPDQEGEYSLKNEYHAEEDYDFINESGVDYVKPGFVPESTNRDIPLTDIHIPLDSPEGVSFSVINSKPVTLGNDTPESQPPIIKGRPGLSSSSTFVNNSEATVSIGQMTNLQPNEDLDVPTNPLYNVYSSNVIRKPQPVDKNNFTLPRPFDNTVYTMNMDEKPPLRDFKAPPHTINYDLPAPVDMEMMRLNPRPVPERKPVEANVVGLTPPAVSRPIESQTHRPTRRPPPLRKRPTPPYKFEIPNRVKQPVLPDTERPPPPPAPTEVLSPPRNIEDSYLPQTNQPISSEQDYPKITTPSSNNNLPALRGPVVYENSKKPQIIAAESKVTNNHPQIQPSSPFSLPKEESSTISTGTFAKPHTVIASHANELIIGSESVIPDDYSQSSSQGFSFETKPVQKISSVSSTKFSPTTSRLFKPSRTVQKYKTAIPLHLNPVNDSEASESMDEGDKVLYHVKNDARNDQSSHRIEFVITPSPTTHIVTHTQTLTVTTTESRVVQSKGQKPSTHTLVVTKTLTSTILDTVTEVHTIVKPTSILATVTTTIPQATTTVYPTMTTQQTSTVAATTEKQPVKAVVREEFPYKNHQPEIITSSNQNQSGTLNESDTILVVMTDKNTNHKLNSFGEHLEPAPEIEGPEVETNEVAPNVLLSGYLSQFGDNQSSACKPECRATRNERCQKVNATMRCVCRPGFARMFPDQPCKQTYTYSVSLGLDRHGKNKLNPSPSWLGQTTNPQSVKFLELTKEAVDRMVMQSELRDVYQGLPLTNLQRTKDGSPVANFSVQLSENFDDGKLIDLLKKYLVLSNFSIGGTDLFTSKAKLEYLKAEDFNECSDERFHDCSENAQCFNLRGSYTCSCKEGFTDLSHNTLYPGRICSADMLGCERCNYHGNCYVDSMGEELCDCFNWYAGQYCQVNLKVLLLILTLAGVSLGVLLVVCVLLSCMRHKKTVVSSGGGAAGGGTSHLHHQPRRVLPAGFRIRPPPPLASDKRAMISLDTSSEASLDPPPFIAPAPPQRVAERPKPCRKTSKAPSPPVGGGTLEQRDRSCTLTVMIPRAKYRPVSAAGSNLLTMSTFGPSEQKLLKYLTPERQQSSGNNSRKPSNSTNHSQESTRERESRIPKKSHSPHLRKPSTGALVSAGFEVSATVGRTKELQECYISEPHTDLGQPGFSTIRTAESSILVDIPAPPTLEAELLDTTRVDLLTVSEVRSYDETTIHPATKTLRVNNYDKNEDSHTMVERDTGSTFIMPQSQLFKPVRSSGSDVSNFDSL